ncbi:MAG TPA: class I SAM-dependent methyltransferase [Candidatus Dormibacteraeota bacterium]|nr:class I SAM-dependent methyltransferase [Candidatus Dormibacteraeota bacterium]
MLDRADTTGSKNHLVDLIHRRAIERAIARPGGVVLDFGCGIGRLTGWLADSAAFVVGVEITPEMLAVARHRTQAENVGWVLFDGERLPLCHSSIDQAVSVYVLQHVLEPPRLATLATEFGRVIRPGGRLVLVEQVRQAGQRLVNRFLQQRPVAVYSRVFQAAGFRLVEAVPIRIPSRAVTVLSRLHAPAAALVRLADLRLTLGRNGVRDRLSADFLMTFDRT